MTVLAWSGGALLTGFLLDMLCGDPHKFPHIVRWMGKLIAALEKYLRQTKPATENVERRRGLLLVGLVIMICTGLPSTLLLVSYRLALPLGYIVESLLCYQLLAAKSLKTESMKVCYSLQNGDLAGARKHLSMIVGRDVSILDEKGLCRAAVETVAENAADGVTAPLLFMMVGGAPLGCLYKAVNTMDSMVGYKNSEYLNFGRAAAQTDDALNYLPSRLCAILLICSAYLLGLNGKNAFRIWRRDRRKHSSPNSAQSEAACAGALGIRLGGPASYFGEIYDKPYIGDDTRPIRTADISEANRLMYAASILMLLMALLFRIICWSVFYGTI